VSDQDIIDLKSAFAIYQNPGFLEILAKYSSMSVLDLGGLLFLVKKRPILGYMGAFLAGPENFEPFDQWWKKAEELSFSYLNIQTNIECSSLKSCLISPKNNYNMIVDLRVGEENLLKTFSKNKRRNIRRAMKQNVVIRDPKNDTESKELYQIFLKGSQQGKLFEVPHLSFITELILSNYGKALIAVYEDKIVGGSFSMLGHKIINGLISGYDREYGHLNFGNLLHYQMMHWGISSGYKFYDMGHQSLNQNANLTQSKMQFRPKLKPAYVYNIPKSKSKIILADAVKYLSERFVKNFAKKTAGTHKG
jgi:lipid II:glycine glycyltransferase (peptidoglycan interpeptide bridge formation enzyme)